MIGDRAINHIVFCHFFGREPDCDLRVFLSRAQCQNRSRTFHCNLDAQAAQAALLFSVQINPDDLSIASSIDAKCVM
jgi:hypothetical protein